MTTAVTFGLKVNVLSWCEVIMVILVNINVTINCHWWNKPNHQVVVPADQLLMRMESEGGLRDTQRRCEGFKVMIRWAGGVEVGEWVCWWCQSGLHCCSWWWCDQSIDKAGRSQKLNLYSWFRARKQLSLFWFGWSDVAERFALISGWTAVLLLIWSTRLRALRQTGRSSVLLCLSLRGNQILNVLFKSESMGWFCILWLLKSCKNSNLTFYIRCTFKKMCEWIYISGHSRTKSSCENTV